LAIPRADHPVRHLVNIPSPSSVAGFQTIFTGRFWVITEGLAYIALLAACCGRSVLVTAPRRPNGFPNCLPKMEGCSY
jgi:hypothetical protein